MPKALFINPAQQLIVPLQVDGWKVIKALVNGSLSIAQPLGRRCLCYLNDNGLHENPQHFVQFGATPPIAGNVVVFGPTRGSEETDITMTVEELAAEITFLDREGFKTYLRRHGDEMVWSITSLGPDGPVSQASGTWAEFAKEHGLS